MATVRGHLNGVNSAARTGNWFEKLTRIGFASKGVVYVVLGLLAFMAATGNGGETASKQSVIERIARAPFGELMLIVIVVGLLAYAAWRFVAAFKDTDHKGSNSKGLGKRAAYVASGITYMALALTAVQILLGARGASGDKTQSWTSRLLELPMGELLVGMLGILVIAVGIIQIRKGYLEKFRKHLQGGETEWNVRAGKVGYIARGFIFCLIGLFLIVAAVEHDPSAAKGLEGTLDTLARQTYGSVLLALTGVGLAAYGAYMFVEAKYRRVRH
jgi:hypothetical protein